MTLSSINSAHPDTTRGPALAHTQLLRGKELALSLEPIFFTAAIKFSQQARCITMTRMMPRNQFVFSRSILICELQRERLCHSVSVFAMLQVTRPEGDNMHNSRARWYACLRNIRYPL